MNPIRNDDEYNNYSAIIKANYGKMNIPMKIDITTGDEITPKEVEYSYKFMFEDKIVNIMAYPLEAILAEKYETVIRRNIGNSRSSSEGRLSADKMEATYETYKKIMKELGLEMHL